MSARAVKVAQRIIEPRAATSVEWFMRVILTGYFPSSALFSPSWHFGWLPGQRLERSQPGRDHQRQQARPRRDEETSRRAELLWYLKLSATPSKSVRQTRWCY